jgi:hypothetical protein
VRYLEGGNRDMGADGGHPVTSEPQLLFKRLNGGANHAFHHAAPSSMDGRYRTGHAFPYQYGDAVGNPYGATGPWCLRGDSVAFLQAHLICLVAGS